MFTRERGLINAAAVERLLDAHRDGTVNGGDAIWALLNFELWFRTFIDGASDRSSAGAPARVGRAVPARGAKDGAV